jgi:hypothetical protein
MDTAGDGFFATFARPTDALRCAREIVDGVAELGLAVRVGLHAGEVETGGSKASGITVHVAARLMAAAGPDEVLVSATVRDLVAGAGWTFQDRGELELKGLSEPLHAFALGLGATPAAALEWSARGSGGGVVNRRNLIAAGALIGLVALAAVVGSKLDSSGAGSAPPASLVAAIPSAGGLATQGAVSPPAASSDADHEFAIFDQYPLVKDETYLGVNLPGEPSLTVPDDGWSLYYSGTGNVILARTTSPDDKVTIRWLNSLASDPCALQPLLKVGSDPESQFIAWARSAKGLRLGPVVTRKFGDLATNEFDVSVVDRDACQYSTPPSVAVTGTENFGAVESAGTVTLTGGEAFRLDVASRDSKLILIITEAPSAPELQALEPLAERILIALKFPPSPP